ncbi:hypothetical protein KC19_VG196100 [Ceratodon purpureus]|uniref:Uncharacterized protein n=1 Tax=Ceratodon purpureus TaxID=3225 RepID=A0A8T0HRM7_CERPU|nr:hypothetical protein KC19_VG196100 [Ceratodon purpureus]
MRASVGEHNSATVRVGRLLDAQRTIFPPLAPRRFVYLEISDPEAVGQRWIAALLRALQASALVLGYRSVGNCASMAPGPKPRRAPQDWASTQRKGAPSTVKDDLGSGPSGVSAMLNVLLPQRKAPAGLSRPTSIRGTRKLSPPADAADNVVEEYLSSVHSKGGAPAHMNAPPACPRENSFSRTQEGMSSSFPSRHIL